MRYLVTGGAGFVGSHLVERLCSTEGVEVVVLDDFSTGRRENLSRWRGQVELIEGSVTDPDICSVATRGVDYVLHQAALGSVPRSVADPIRTHRVNLSGTLNVLLAARESGVKRVIFASSSSVYGDTPTLPKRESMIPNPQSPYAVTKLGGEAYCQAAAHVYGVETVALRYFNVYGPRQDPTSQYAAVIPMFIECAIQDNNPTIHGDGEQTRDFTFVGDVVEANLRACAAPDSAVGRPFNVGGGNRTTINKLWSLVAGVTATSAEPVYVPPRPGDVRDSLAAVDDLQEVLGFRPRMPLAKGLEVTVQWYRDEAERRRARAAAR